MFTCLNLLELREYAAAMTWVQWISLGISNWE
uniref:Uncharacterized protein n=1 Tax=Anguilla anguilla TaxID=7936 RepID=A0A0E9QLU4_ANGAN